MATRSATSSHTLKISPARADDVRAWLVARAPQFAFRDLDHAFWQARLDGVTVSFYRSGKVLVQGAEATLWAEELLASAVPAHLDAKTQKLALDAPSSLEPSFDKPPAATWIGIDETGKGDYFGPLVACAVRLREEDLGWLLELGVGDSKTIADAQITTLARQLAPVVPHEIIRIGPAKYNELYAKFGNLNKLLAWAHATSAEKLLETHTAEAILSDQFSPEPIVPRYFKGPGKEVRFLQRPKAEADAAVACASILARNAFLRSLERLEREFGVKLHKGAGEPVLAAGRKLVAQHGPDLLGQVAKLHFKTTQQLGVTG